MIHELLLFSLLLQIVHHWVMKQSHGVGVGCINHLHGIWDYKMNRKRRKNEEIKKPQWMKVESVCFRKWIKIGKGTVGQSPEPKEAHKNNRVFFDENLSLSLSDNFSFILSPTLSFSHFFLSLSLTLFSLSSFRQLNRKFETIFNYFFPYFFIYCIFSRKFKYLVFSPQTMWHHLLMIS